MARLRSNFQRGSLSANAASGDISLSSNEFSTLPVVASPDYLMIVLDPDAVHGNPEIVKVTAHTSSATTVTMTRAQEGTSARSHNSSTTWRHVPTSTDWVRVSETAVDIKTYDEATTDLPTAMSKALTDLGSGGEIILPPGAYTSGNILLAGLSNVTIRGSGNAQINWSGTGASGLGFQLSGTNTNLVIRDLILNGDGVLANKHTPVWQSTTAGTLNGLKVLNCKITNVMAGVLVNYDTGTLTDVLIQGCYIDNCVGTSAGQGYGVNVSGPVGTAAHVRIISNTISRAHRHDIYCSKGAGFLVMGNTTRLHRTGDSLGGSPLSSIVCSRVTDALLTGNVVDSANDCAFEISPTSGFSCQNISVVDNLVSNPTANASPYGLVLGSSVPATDGTPEDILIDALKVFASSMSNPAVTIYSGKRVTIANSKIRNLNCGHNASAIYWAGLGESGASATYSDYWKCRNNDIYMTAGVDTGYAWEIGSLAAVSAIHMDFDNPEPDVPTNAFLWDAAQTNLNVRCRRSITLGTPTTSGVNANITVNNVDGSNDRFRVTFATNATPPGAGSALFTVNFTDSWPLFSANRNGSTGPNVQVTIANGQTGALGGYQCTGSSVKIVNGTALGANSTYVIDVAVLG